MAISTAMMMALMPLRILDWLMKLVCNLMAAVIESENLGILEYLGRKNLGILENRTKRRVTPRHEKTCNLTEKMKVATFKNQDLNVATILQSLLPDLHSGCTGVTSPPPWSPPPWSSSPEGSGVGVGVSPPPSGFTGVTSPSSALLPLSFR